MIKAIQELINLTIYGHRFHLLYSSPSPGKPSTLCTSPAVFAVALLCVALGIQEYTGKKMFFCLVAVSWWSFKNTAC